MFPKSVIRICGLSLLAAGLFASRANAASQTWNGGSSGGGGDWMVGGNWVGSPADADVPGSTGAPSANADIAKIGAGNASGSINIFTSWVQGTLSLGAIDFNNNLRSRQIGTANGTFVMQLNGATIGGVANTILRNNADGDMTLARRLSLIPATMTIALGNTTNNIISTTARGDIVIGAPITGAGRTLTLNGTSTGVLIFGTGTSNDLANTYSGPTIINAGELDLNKVSGLTGLTSIAGNLSIGDGVGAANTAIVRLNYADQIANGSIVTIASDGQLDFSNTVSGGDTVGVVHLAGGSITDSGSFQGLFIGSAYHFDSGSASANLGGSGVALTKATGGTVTLSGANTYTGTTAVNGGTLLVNGNQSAATGAVSVTGSGSVLGGTGTIGGAVSLLSSGTLRGGTGAAASGTLTLANTVNTSGGIIQLALGATGADHSSLITTNGAWTFDGNQLFNFLDLGVDLSGGPVTYSGIITGLASDPGVATWSMNITNPGWDGSFAWNGTNGIDFTLISTVPEPGTWTAGILCVVTLVGWSQRRRFARRTGRAS
jgi:autotransporter-associated beta strand protein